MTTEQRTDAARIVVHPADEGGFWADSPDLPGLVTVGETLEAVRANAAAAVAAWRDEPVGATPLFYDYPVTNK